MFFSKRACSVLSSSLRCVCEKVLFGIVHSEKEMEQIKWNASSPCRTAPLKPKSGLEWATPSEAGFGAAVRFCQATGLENNRRTTGPFHIHNPERIMRGKKTNRVGGA